MDLLQRIQRWYTINCDGDWEHEYTVSITKVDNPGWWVIIDLQGTCLVNGSLPKLSNPIAKRSSTDWTMWYVENQQFIGSGGPGNLSDILSYFLEVFLPANIDPDCTYDVHLPVLGYEGKLWLKAEARMLSESTLQIVAIADSQQVHSYEWSTDEELELFNKLIDSNSLPKLQAHCKVGDAVDPYVFEAEDNMLRTFLVAPSVD